MSAAALLPHPTIGIDPTSLPIGPKEAFVLSQVDGMATLPDISACTGFSEEEIEDILRLLERLGAVHFETPPPLERTSPSRAPSELPPRSFSRTGSSSTRMRAVGWKPDDISNDGSSPGSAPDADSARPHERNLALTNGLSPHLAAIDPALLDEPAEIDRETKLEILEMFSGLERHSYYELLGVSPDADKKLIKAAYFERVNVFHTDRFYGKDLGAFRARLERIFATLTKAHDTLTRAKLREEYDRYLASRQMTRGVRDSLPPSGIPSQPPAQSVRSLESPAIPRAPKPPRLGTEGIPALDLEPISVLPGSDPPEERAARPTPAAPRTLDPNAARRLLAKKLGHRTSPAPSAAGPQSLHPTPSSAPQSPADREQLKKVAAEQLRQRFEARQGSPSSQVQRYVDMAEAARAKREWGSALNNVRIALTLLPDDPRLLALRDEVQDEADRVMADQFFEQARYEEGDGHFERAARSYERAARGKQASHQSERAAQLFERAAHCLLEARGDRRKIVELARQAVTLDIQKPHFRLTLARAYDYAGMRSSALGEVGRALELDPQNEEAKNLQKQFK